MKSRGGPDGIHFFNRETGINILVDEIAVPEETWSRAPRQVSIALTNACELRCPYCYAPKNPANLRSDRVSEWLKQLDGEGCLGVGFGGGEPTLHRDFTKLCRFAASETELAVTFTTHAHHIDDRLAADLSGSVHFIRVSMDGVGATYEALRGRSFASLQARLLLVRAIAPFGINFVVNAETFGDINQAIAIATECGASEFLLLPERPTKDRQGIDRDTRDALLAWVQNFKSDIRLAISESDADCFPVCDPLEKERGMRSYIHIDASGFLKRSSFDRDGVLIGNNIFRALEELSAWQGD